MISNLRPAFLIVVAVGLLCTARQVQAAQAGPDRAGYELLERLVAAVAVAARPAPVATDISPELLRLARDLKAAQAAKRVDDLFAVRFGRLLSAVRQAVLTDPEVLYWPMYRHTMMDFIEERTGRTPDWKEVLFHVNNHGGSGVGLALLADAVMSEVVSLHLHLETLPKRAEVLKGYLERSVKAPGNTPNAPRH